MEIELPYDPAIPLLGIHTEETRSERDTCTPMFMAALFIIARTWKQPRCPSADEWIRWGEVGGGIRMGNTCKSMANSCQCMAKTTTTL